MPIPDSSFPVGWAFLIQEENLFWVCSNFRNFHWKQQASFSFLFIVLFYYFIVLAPFSLGAGDELYSRH